MTEQHPPYTIPESENTESAGNGSLAASEQHGERSGMHTTATRVNLQVQVPPPTQIDTSGGGSSRPCGDSSSPQYECGNGSGRKRSIREEATSPVEKPTSQTPTTRSSRSPIRGRRQPTRAHSEPPLSQGHKRRRGSDRRSGNNYLPPINLSTLKELDLNEIYDNGKLRHDSVFDPQLHFRPNNDGPRGARKQKEADDYWKAVLDEVRAILTEVAEKRKTDLPPKRLPLLFATMRDILLTLVPRADREEIQSVLDPDLIMQQLTRGILDMKKLATWLARLLKCHCAPMRDASVEAIVSTIARGVDAGSARDLVEGLRLVFMVLEAMKLDVANHQIRTLRPHLVNTAISFEQAYFQTRIEIGRYKVEESRKWFKDAYATWCTKSTDLDYRECFVHAVMEMLTPSRRSAFHPSFVFDLERLAGFRDDIQDAVCLKICNLLFSQLSKGKHVDAAASKALSDSILGIIGEDCRRGWSRNIKNVALHIAYSARQLQGLQLDEETSKFAEGWLNANLSPPSRLYTLVEESVIREIREIVRGVMKKWATYSTFPVDFTGEVRGASSDIANIGQRISHVAFMNWKVFYEAYVSAAEGRASYSLVEKPML